MSQKSKPRYVPGRKNLDDKIASYDLSDLIKRHYRGDWSRVDDALGGVRSMPLDALMHGFPPAGGDVVKDFFLWEAEIRLDVEAYASQPRHFLIEASQDLGFESLDAARVAVGSKPWEADEHALRIDYWSALLGDVDAARRLVVVFGQKPGLTSAFAHGLDAHAMRIDKSHKEFVFRPGLGSVILMNAVSQQVEQVSRAADALHEVDVWARRRREEDGDAAAEAVRQSRDNAALDVVDRGAAVVDAQLEKKHHDAYVAEVAEKPDAYADFRAAQEGLDAAGRRMVAGAFKAWKAKRAAGVVPSDDDVRAAADEVLCRWEIDEDRRIPIDIEDLDVARRVIADQLAMDGKEVEAFAKAALNDPQKLRLLAGNYFDEDRKIAVLAAGGVPLTKALMDLCRISDEDFNKRVQDLFVAKLVAPIPEDQVNEAEAERKREEAKARAAKEEVLRQAAEKAAARRVLVLDPVDTSGMGKDRSELLDQVRPLGLEPLELAEVEGLADVRREMVETYPHAVEVVDRILADLVEGEPFKVRPTLLVGSPGAGKTSLLVDMGVLLHVSRLVYPCAGVADASFAGTSAQWGTRRISIPLETIRTSGIPNPLIVLDEIEKAGVYNSNGGRLVDCLLPLLEAHSACEFFEIGIERRAQLQHVSYVATANSLEGIPAPLRDRMRVLRMPDPGPEHVGDLVRGIVGRIRSERGLDRRWVPDLAPDEESVVRKAWAGGSLRRLRRAVEATLDARESVLRGRAM